MKRYVIVYQDEDGAWIAEAPSLPGCTSFGNSLEDALENVKEAMQGYINLLVEDNIEVPQEYANLQVATIDVTLHDQITDSIK